MRKKKTSSILRKFLVFNLTVFSILGLFTIIYLEAIQPNLVNKRVSNHNIIIKNTTDHLERLNVKLNKEEINKFLLSTGFIFQGLDRVQFFSNKLELIGDTNILDLDTSVFEKSDEDLLQSLKLNPEDAYVLNYLAYSWLERNFKIEIAIDMLERAYKKESDSPYILDSIGWAYYLIGDYIKAEKFLKQAIEIMPYDPIINDHYGDILWSLNRKMQAQYHCCLL